MILLLLALIVASLVLVAVVVLAVAAQLQELVKAFREYQTSAVDLTAAYNDAKRMQDQTAQALAALVESRAVIERLADEYRITQARVTDDLRRTTKH